MSDEHLRNLERAQRAEPGSREAKARLARERLRQSPVDWSAPLAWVRRRLRLAALPHAARLLGEAMHEALSGFTATRSPNHGIAWRVVGWKPHVNKIAVGQVLAIRPEGASVRIYSASHMTIDELVQPRSTQIRDPIRFAVQLENASAGDMVFASDDGVLSTKQSDGFRRYALAVVLQNLYTSTAHGPALVVGIGDAPGIMATNPTPQTGTPPTVAWPFLGTRRLHAWTYSGRHPYEPSAPQVERCRAWACHRFGPRSASIDDDRLPMPLAVAAALADALIAEGGAT